MVLRFSLSITALALLCLPGPAGGQSGIPRTPAPEGAALYFITPENGDTVQSPFVVRFGLRGMGVAPSGIDSPKTGHHHLIVDAELPALNIPIPNDDKHIHFGGGQTEVELELPPGPHTLQLLLGDSRHIPHEPPIQSERISVTVK